MKNLRQLIGPTPRTPVAVSPGDTVLTALRVMAEHGIGAVLVTEGGKLTGIFSERDYARKVVLVGKNSTDTCVRDIMTEKVFYMSPEQSVSEAMAMMSDKHIRHMPILDEQMRVLAVVSQGDLVKEKISEQAFQIEQLERYIAS
jgi:CBS domain-containing protein